jgi:hypothetical protein
VISLLGGRLDKTGFGATLADLAARGWFEVRAPGGQAGPGGWGPAGPAMCVVPARAPGGELTPFERRVVAHVALRAGARGEVPALALSDGFGGGESEFMSAFRGEVDAEARRRGLTRPWLSGRRIALLCLTLLIPAVAVLVAGAVTHERAALFYAAGLYVVGCGVAIGVGTSRRNSAAGRAALDRWRSAVAAAPSGGGRLPAYAAALGGAPAALAVFGQGGGGGGNVAWSSYRGGWQQIEIESNTWSWPKGCAIAVAIGFGPIAFFAAVLWLAFNGMGAIAWELVGLTAAGAVAGTLVWLARRKVFPPFAEFDGQVIRQWMVKGDSDSEDEYHVAIDDGVRGKAWDLSIGSEPYRRLPPGTFVHTRVNLRNRSEVTVAPVEPPAVAWPLERVAADQERAVTDGLPDPAGLVTAAEAAAVLGRPVEGKHLDGTSGRTMVWQPPGTSRPMLRVEVRHAGRGAGSRPAPPTAQPVPGVADGYLLGQGAVVNVPSLTAVISVHGAVRAGAPLAGLLPAVEGRLRQQSMSPLGQRPAIAAERRLTELPVVSDGFGRWVIAAEPGAGVVSFPGGAGTVRAGGWPDRSVS